MFNLEQYRLQFKTERNDTIVFSYTNGVIADLANMTGTSASFDKSQNYQQVGTNVSNISVGGVSRTIKGIAVTDAAQRTIINKLVAGEKGTLTVIDPSVSSSSQFPFTDYVISKAPTFTYKNGKRSFTMQIFCPDPWWHIGTGTTYPLSTSRSVAVSGTNVDVPLNLSFQAGGGTVSTSWGVRNTDTGEQLSFTGSLTSGDYVDVYVQNGVIKAVKNGSTNFLNNIAPASNLFKLYRGTNNLQLFAQVGSSYLIGSVTREDAYAGLPVPFYTPQP